MSHRTDGIEDRVAAAFGHRGFGYKKTIEDALAFAATLFVPPINWEERTSVVSIVADHPGVGMSTTAAILSGRLWLS